MNTAIMMLKKRDVVRRMGRSYGTLFNQQREGIFPPGVRVTARMTLWPAHEVDAVLDAEIGGATKAQLRTLVVRLLAEREARKIAATAPGPVARQKAKLADVDAQG